MGKILEGGEWGKRIMQIFRHRLYIKHVYILFSCFMIIFFLICFICVLNFYSMLSSL